MTQVTIRRDPQVVVVRSGGPGARGPMGPSYAGGIGLNILDSAFGGTAAMAQTTVDAAGNVTGVDCSGAYLSALAYGQTLGVPFAIFMPGNFYTTQMLPVVSNMTVMYQGNIYMKLASIPSNPRAHQKMGVFSMCGIETDRNDATTPNALGDYFTTPPRAFPTNSVLKAGLDTITVTASTITDVTVGSWLFLTDAYGGWHSCNCEYVQVKSKTSTTLTFYSPLRNTYSNTTYSFSAWNKLHNRSQFPPGVNNDSWPLAGFRRVGPVVNSAIYGQGTLVNLSDYTASGYGNWGVFAWAAIGCYIEVEVGGGSAYFPDCQDMIIPNLQLGPQLYPTSTVDMSALFNGSLGTHLSSPTLNVANLRIEEGVQSMTVTDVTLHGGIVQVQAGCRDTLFDRGDIDGPAAGAAAIGIGIYQGGNRNLTIRDVNSCGNNTGLAMYGTSLLDIFPSTQPEFWPETEPWFRGEQTFVDNGLFQSPSNYSMYLEQPIRVNDARLRDPGGGAVSGLGTPYVFGKAISDTTGANTGSLTSTAKPTVAALGVGQEVLDAVTPKTWKCFLWRTDQFSADYMTPGGPPTSNILQCNPAAGQANYWVAGDVLIVPIRSHASTSTIFVKALRATIVTGSLNVVQVSDATGVQVGMAATQGLLFPNGTVVTSISGNNITVSNNAGGAVAASAGIDVTFGMIFKKMKGIVTAWNSSAGWVTLDTNMPTGYRGAGLLQDNMLQTTRWG